MWKFSEILGNNHFPPNDNSEGEKNMKKTYDYILSQNPYDCGISCLITILMYYGIKPSREKIVNSITKKHGGYTAYDLIKVSKSYGIDAYGIKENIKKVTKLPAIAHTIKNGNMFHFIVILEKNNNYLKIMDPSLGITIITCEEFDNITTGIFLIFNGKKKRNCHDTRFKKELISICKSNKKLIIKTILVSLILVLFSLIFNYFLKLILEAKNINQVLRLFILFIVVLIIKNLLDYKKNKKILELNLILDKKITEKVSNHILLLPYKYYISKTTGELLTIIEDIENFKEIISKIFILSSVDLILLSIIIIYVSFLSLPIGIILAIYVLLMILITKKYQYLFNDSYIKYKNKKIDYSSTLVNTISSFESIKNLNIIKVINNKLKEKHQTLLKEEKTYNEKFNNYNLIVGIITDYFYIFVIVITSIISLNKGIKLLDIVLFSSIFYMLSNFLTNITESISLLKVYQTSTDRILDMLEIKKETFKKSNHSQINSITFKNINYKIEEKNILKNTNLQIKKGEKIFITGKSGIGKSTLIKLMLRYFNLDKGKILIDNINIKDYDLSFIRENITYIGQNEVLFSGTIMDNLKLIESDDKKIKEAAKISLLEKMIKNKQIDYNYPVEEFGYNLSGGERKKIILTRGLLKFKEVLVLDEVFNEISPEEERIIQKKIFEKYKDKIIIVISHHDKNKDLFTKKYELKEEGDLIEIK